MRELKRCPFCGGNANTNKYNDQLLIFCEDCGCGTMSFCKEDLAVELWNRRVEDGGKENVRKDNH